MNNIDEYVLKIDQVKKTIEEVPLEIAKGTKKMKKKYHEVAITERNLFVTNMIASYQQDLAILKETLDAKVDQILPESKSVDIDLYKNKLLLLNKVLKYNNPYNDYNDKTSFEKIIYEMDNIENSNLKEVNSVLLYIINKFDRSFVKLNNNDFSYTVYTKKYMTYFFDNLNSDDFDEIMADKFNEIYWNCPNLLTHLKLNINFLVEKYKARLLEFCTMKRTNLFEQTETNTENYEEVYKETRINYEESIKNDAYTNIYQFINGEVNVNDYLASSSYKKSVISKFTIEEFSNIENHENFYLEVLDLGYTVEEIENYRYFEPIIKDIVNRYNNIAKNKGVTKLKNKQISKLEKLKNKNVSKYNKLDNANNIKFSNKLNKLSSLINEQITSLNTLYRELEDARINDKIAKFINDESTIYDAALLANSFYGYLKSVIVRDYELETDIEVIEIMEKFYSFVYNPNNVIIKKFVFLDQNDFELLIKNKYKLFDITLNDDFSASIDDLKKNIKFVERLYHLEKNNINLEDIKFVCEVKKI